jgi:hypothetical protein
MSHASVLIAIRPTDDVDAAVAEQMAPFEENAEWFADGSRWDRYQIGGRWTGMLDQDYDPEKDPANTETCDLCDGTGTRPDGRGGTPDRPDKKEGVCIRCGLSECDCRGWCNGCRGAGHRTKWPTQWARYDGDVAPKDAVAKGAKAFAFLRDRTWNERERMGWFGGSSATECERAGAEQAKVCTHIDEKTSAKIVSWGDEEKRWDAKFYKRFIAPLPDDALLVVVDFHV